MKKIRLILIVFVLAFASAIFAVARNSTDSAREVTESQTKTNNLTANHQASTLTIGDSAAPVTIVEYLDYKCPSCNNFHRTIAKEIDAAYIEGSQAKYEIRITPVIGPDSATAARGAYCANEQNQFEAYHNLVLDYMYDNYYSDGNFAAEFENILSVSRLGSIVKDTSIELIEFTSCAESEKFNSNLDANLNAAADDSIQGTPGFAIGEQSFVGGQPFSVFKTLIDIELQSE